MGNWLVSKLPVCSVCRAPAHGLHARRGTAPTQAVPSMIRLRALLQSWCTTRPRLPKQFTRLKCHLAHTPWWPTQQVAGSPLTQTWNVTLTRWTILIKTLTIAICSSNQLLKEIHTLLSKLKGQLNQANLPLTMFTLLSWHIQIKQILVLPVSAI